MQDVVLLGLRIDGCAVVSPVVYDLRAMCEELLGMTPDDRELTGTWLQLKWLREHFGSALTDDINEDDMRQFA